MARQDYEMMKNTDWYILTACQPICGYLKYTCKGITLVLYSYLHFCEVVSKMICFHFFLFLFFANGPIDTNIWVNNHSASTMSPAEIKTPLNRVLDIAGFFLDPPAEWDIFRQVYLVYHCIWVGVGACIQILSGSISNSISNNDSWINK